tara:strand:+ start:619 stop:798 length:180 start_codon:yes stop_codon:yes gene_type:complete
MKHIRQKNSVGTNTYTIIVTLDWTLPLEQHPSVVEHPELFEISEDEIPVEHQYLIYESA